MPCWVVPVAVLCPVYSFLLLTTDDEDFYQRGVPLPLDQLPALVHLLKVRNVCPRPNPRLCQGTLPTSLSFTVRAKPLCERRVLSRCASATARGALARREAVLMSYQAAPRRCGAARVTGSAAF